MNGTDRVQDSRSRLAESELMLWGPIDGRTAEGFHSKPVSSFVPLLAHSAAILLQIRLGVLPVSKSLGTSALCRPLVASP